MSANILNCDADVCQNVTSEEVPYDEAAWRQSENAECCVCLEVVYRKEDVSDRYFGILSGCDHTFCYACISRWRHEHKTCPMCRVSSALALKSKTLLGGNESSARKHAAIEKHRICINTAARCQDRGLSNVVITTTTSTTTTTTTSDNIIGHPALSSTDLVASFNTRPPTRRPSNRFRPRRSRRNVWITLQEGTIPTPDHIDCSLWDATITGWSNFYSFGIRTSAVW